MGQIISLIIKIFSQIFEEDRARREQQAQLVAAASAAQRNKKEGEPPALETFLEELRKLQGMPASQPQHAADPAQGPPGYQQTAMQKAYREQQQKRETLEEHLRQREAEIARIEQRARDLERQAAQHLGLKLGHTHQDTHHFQLPGKTPLEQLMYAQVILGPCKAHQGSRRI